MSDDALDTWRGLLDEQRQRGGVYRAALVKLRDLVLDDSVTRAKLIDEAVAIYERAVDEAWAKPGDAKPESADDYWSPEPMSPASAEFMARQSGSREGADR